MFTFSFVQLSVAAPGGMSSTYNMNVVGPGSQLTYENFIYIALTATGSDRSENGRKMSENRRKMSGKWTENERKIDGK